MNPTAHAFADAVLELLRKLNWHHIHVFSDEDAVASHIMFDLIREAFVRDVSVVAVPFTGDTLFNTTKSTINQVLGDSDARVSLIVA